MRYQPAGIRARILRRCQVAICLLAFASIAWTARATDSGIGEARLSSSTSASVQRLIVVGFVGGLVHHDDGRHPEVQLAERIRAAYADHVETQVFENRHKRKAHRAIVALLDSDHDGSLSEYEKRSATIILFGHSWGASAAVGLARDLEREGIPVRLIVQVDSIARIGENDSVIPANVAQAVNFFQTRGIFHGRARITAADPSRTQILGNIRLDYSDRSGECQNYPWYDRYLFRGHIQIECDAGLWSRVEALIRQQMTASYTATEWLTSGEAPRE